MYAQTVAWIAAGSGSAAVFLAGMLLDSYLPPRRTGRHRNG